jgi:hypothetical protein
MSLNPLFENLLRTLTPHVQDASTQTDGSSGGTEAQRQATPRAAGLALHSDVLEQLWVYKPWTGLVLELWELDCDAELEDALADGTRPHMNNQCFQAFVTDVRVHIGKSTDHTNQLQLSYTPVYTVWVPEDGSLFEIDGSSLPAAVNAHERCAWSFEELYEMEMSGIGKTPLKNGLRGPARTFVPVLQKSCCIRVRGAEEYADMPQKYPPVSLRSSKSMPEAWQPVAALPGASSAPCEDAMQTGPERFPHVCKISDVREFAFDPVLFDDVVDDVDRATSSSAVRFSTPKEEYQHAYYTARNAFLASMRPLYELVTDGGRPREHGWALSRTQRHCRVERVWTHEPHTDALFFAENCLLGKRKANESVCEGGALPDR